MKKKGKINKTKLMVILVVTLMVCVLLIPTVTTIYIVDDQQTIKEDKCKIFFCDPMPDVFSPEGIECLNNSATPRF